MCFGSGSWCIRNIWPDPVPIIRFINWKFMMWWAIVVASASCLTSVDVMMGKRPLLKSLNASSRSQCGRSPCMAVVGYPSPERKQAATSASLALRTSMSILVPESRGSPRTASRSPSILPGMTWSKLEMLTRFRSDRDWYECFALPPESWLYTRRLLRKTIGSTAVQRGGGGEGEGADLCSPLYIILLYLTTPAAWQQRFSLASRDQWFSMKVTGTMCYTLRQVQLGLVRWKKKKKTVFFHTAVASIFCVVFSQTVFLLQFQISISN